MKLLSPIEKIYQLGTAVKNSLYDHGFLNQVKLPVPVVSIGNMSFGGVGKTPFTVWLAHELSQEMKVAVVCKSYKARLTEASRVNLAEPDSAQIYGDEACLLQKLLPNCSVWSGPEKNLTAQACLKSNPQIILVDDGFSHRKLVRDLDIVLIDASVGLNDYLREPQGSLSRAHLVVLTKTNVVLSRDLERLRGQVLRLAPHLKNLVLTSATEFKLNLPAKSSVFAFCGLAKPESFWNDLRLQDYVLSDRLSFSDHILYSDKIENKILARYLDLKNENRDIKLVTTLKDAVKLQKSELLKNLHIAEHKLILNPVEKEVVLAKIRALF